MADSRLDAALADRGLARSRSHAAKLIADGLVTVDGRAVVKPSARVSDSRRLEVAESDHYVSRAAHKLVAGLDTFGVDPRGRRALDVGASTGGFTQVLLERGAAQVVALDVGHGQLASSIRADPRVVVVEGVNARYLTRAELADAAGAPSPDDLVLDLVVGDVSFISLSTVLPALVESADPGSDFVLLIKPQFEVGRSGIREGIVTDPSLRAEAVEGVLWSAWDLSLRTVGVRSSPVVGTNGNHEYLVHLSATAGVDPSQWSDEVIAMTKVT